MQRHRRAVRSRHGELVRPAHIGELAIGREDRLPRNPMDFESRRIQTRCHVRADRRLPLEHGLSRKNEHGIVAPVGNNLLDVFAGSGKVCPLRVPTQQLLSLSRRIELQVAGLARAIG